MNLRELHEEFRNRAAIAQLPIPQVLGDGDLRSEIVVIAEAPGYTEEQLGKPLVGGSGKYLWEALRKYGITRNHCYITNVVKYRLVSPDGEDKLKVRPAEFEAWTQLLRWELAQLKNAKYVLLLGNFALEAITGHKGIQKWRGSVVSFTQVIGERPLTYVITLNPAAVLRDPMWTVIFALDLAKLQRVIKGEHDEPRIDAAINPTPREAIQFVVQMRQERIPVSLDIETIAGETACIGLANSSRFGMCINFRTRDANRFDLDDEIRVRRAIQGLVNDPAVRIVAQNGVFDAAWLWYKDRIRIRQVWFDTLLAHHVLYPALPHNLGFLTTQYTDHPYYKDERDVWKEGGDIDSFWRYNVKDCCLTLRIQERLMEELRSQQMDKFFFDHVMRLQPHLVEMELIGVKVDVELKDKITQELTGRVHDLRQRFVESARHATGLADYEPNPASPKQLADLFFNKLALVGRGTSTDSENRKRMYTHPRTSTEAKAVIDTLDTWAKENKFLTTYAECQIDDDGRIRTEYKQYGTVSAPGRLSSSATPWGTGMNMQNQPERSKDMYCADPGWGFVYFDMSQIEARIVGWLANISLWKQQFERARLHGGYDAHRALAADMFEVPYDSVPVKDVNEAGERTIRFIAKRCRHGLNYGMAADRLATVTGLPLQRAVDAYNRYHRLTPEIKDWWKTVEKKLRHDRALYNPYGRRLRVLGRFDDSLVTTGIAFVPQSTAGDHVCGTIYLCHDDPDWPHDARIVLNIHDALIALCRLDDQQRVGEIMRRHAERPIMIEGEPLIVPAELAYSVSEREYYKDPNRSEVHRWSTLKKI